VGPALDQPLEQPHRCLSSALGLSSAIGALRAAVAPWPGWLGWHVRQPGAATRAAGSNRRGSVARSQRFPPVERSCGLPSGFPSGCATPQTAQGRARAEIASLGPKLMHCTGHRIAQTAQRAATTPQPSAQQPRDSLLWNLLFRQHRHVGAGTMQLGFGPVWCRPACRCQCKQCRRQVAT
jgi:hypothetical protein